MKVDGEFDGRIGIVDDTEEYYQTIEDGKTILTVKYPNTISCGASLGSWPG